MSQTGRFYALLEGILTNIGFWNFRHWLLFVIWDLEFGIFDLTGSGIYYSISDREYSGLYSDRFKVALLTADWPNF